MVRVTLPFVVISCLCYLVFPCLAEPQERYIFDSTKNTWVPARELEKPLEGIVGQAQELLERGKIRRAEKILKKYLKTNPDDPDKAPAMLLYADCAFMRGKYRIANRRYQQVVNEFPSTREFALSLRRELEIAKAWLEGKKQRVMGIFMVGAADEALDVLSQIEQLGSGHRIAEVALRIKADYFYRSGQFALAEMEYRRLAKEYKSPRYHKFALYRSAASALASFPGVAFDDTALLEATELFNEYLNNFPNEARNDDVGILLEQIQYKRANKEFDVGQFYVRIRRPRAAAYYFKYVIKSWPDTLWAQRSQSKLEKLGFEIESVN